MTSPNNLTHLVSLQLPMQSITAYSPDQQQRAEGVHFGSQ